MDADQFAYTRSFVRSFKYVAKLETDSMAPRSSDPEAKPYSLTPTEFLEELYVPRDVEHTLLNAIVESRDFLCLVGTRGSGKTSVGLRVIEQLKRERPNYHITLIDLREEQRQTELPWRRPDTVRRELRSIVINDYVREFPYAEPDEPGGVNKRLALEAYLLDDDAQPGLRQEQTRSLAIIRDEAAERLTYWRSLREGREASGFYDWLAATHMQPDVFALRRRLESMFDIPKLVYAARAVLGRSRQVLWFDNVDALNERVQPSVINFVRSFHGKVSDYVSTVVAVREENIFRVYDDDEPTAPPHSTRVCLEMPRLDGDASYPSVDVPVATSDTLKAIVKRRIEYFRRNRAAQPSDGSADNAAAAANGDGTPWHDMLQDVALNLAVGMYEERGLHLFNNSIRDFLEAHRDCLGRLIVNAKKEGQLEKLREPRSWYISTLFHTWVRRTLRLRIRVPLYDIVTVMEDWHSNGCQTVGCYLPHLVVTTVWNLAVEADPEVSSAAEYRRIEVRAVLQRLQKLGFSPDDVRRDIYRLDVKQTLCVWSSSAIKSPSDIADDDFVYVTLRGKCAASVACYSFGYLYECVRQHQQESTGVERPLMQSTSHTEVIATDMLPYLCDIAEMHYDGLYKIRESGLLPQPWLRSYRGWFGVPQERPYVKRSRVGEPINGVHRALQFEVLTSTLLKYVRTGDAVRHIVSLRDQYAQAVDNLRVGGPRQAPGTFREAMGLPLRSGAAKACQARVSSA